MRLLLLNYRLVIVTLTLLSATIYSGATISATVIVAAKESSLVGITDKQAMRVWLGKVARVNGQEVEPTERNDKTDIHASFHEKITHKNAYQLKAYWGRLIFSGKRFPPKVFQSDADIKQWLSQHVKAIAYIDESSVDDTVKVLMKIE